MQLPSIEKSVIADVGGDWLLAPEVTLADLWTELRTVNDRLARMIQIWEGLAQEQEDREKMAGLLPLDIPGWSELVAAGYTTIKSLPRTARRIKDIPGIDADTASQVILYLERQRQENQ